VNIVHVITEVSPVFTTNNILNGVDVTPGCLDLYRVKDFSPDSSVLSSIFNAGMPGDMRGLQVVATSFPGTTTLNWTFDSDKSPVWGDFYARGAEIDINPCDPCGGVSIDHAYLYNSGFLADDPTEPAANGSLDFHLLVPDSAGSQEGPGVIPEPATSMLEAIGLLLILRRRKNN